MSSESEDDDFLSADEGEGQEQQSKINKKVVEITETSQTKNYKDNEIKKNKKSENFNSDSKSNIDLPKDKNDYSVEILDIDDSMEKLNARLHECNIDETLEQNLIRTDSFSKNVENDPDLGQSSVHTVSLDSKSINKEILSKAEAEDVSTVKKVFQEEISLGECKDGVGSDEVTASPPTTTEELACHSSSSTRNIKEAKLGMKKPREKLGERLGSKKLGSRITKPLVGISSDSFNTQNITTAETKSSAGDDAHNTTEDRLLKVDAEESTKDSKDDDDSSAGWGAWGDWGLSLATAATSISREVTRGVGTVLETVESSIGAPDPEELAKEIVEREKKLENLEKESKPKEKESKPKEDEEAAEDVASGPSYSFGFGTLGSLVSGVSGALENASNKVLLGGLDTLEKIGRKTMDIIQEGDPGLRRKRAFLKSNKPNLSSTLREARERAITEEELRGLDLGEKTSNMKNQISMAIIWDDTEGPAHTEALSLVAKQCQGKITGLMKDIPPVYLTNLQDKISNIKDSACINEEDKTENVHSKLMEITRDAELPLQFHKIITGWPSLQQFLSRLSIEICGLGNTDFADIQRDMYKEVAAYVAQVVGLFHKAAEVALITSNLNSVQIAQQFQRLCGCISGGLEKFADDVCESISRAFPASDPEFNGTITNIYLQMAEVNSYLENALLELNTIFLYTQVKGIYNEL